MNSSPPSSPFLNHFWPALVAILTIFGVPVGAIALFHNFLIEHPLLALGIVVLYEVAVFILGFVGKVWLKLEDPLVSHIFEGLTFRVQDRLSVKKTYIEYEQKIVCAELAHTYPCVVEPLSFQLSLLFIVKHHEP